MHVLLLRPVPGNERFGLGPFFRIEPLGMEYIAAALEARGHTVAIADLRFSAPARTAAPPHQPHVVGIAGMHALETDAVLALAREVRRLAPGTPIVLGGHTASAYPDPFLSADVDAVVLDDGERVMPEIVEALAKGRALRDVPGLALSDGSGGDHPHRVEWRSLRARRRAASGAASRRRLAPPVRLPRPSSDLAGRDGARLSVPLLVLLDLAAARALRARALDRVRVPGHGDAAAMTSSSPTICSGITRPAARRWRSNCAAAASARNGFWSRAVPTSSPGIATCSKCGGRLRTSSTSSSASRRRPNEGLTTLAKDATVDQTAEGIAVARGLGYGVTGNFVIDPAWGEADFERLWGFVERHRLFQAGFTILTPLPGTAYFEEMQPRLKARRWAQFDMHHLLWEPALGPERFFELYCETWRRSVLNLRGRKTVWQWLRQVDVRNALFLMRALGRTQRMMDPAHYLAEYDLTSADQSVAALRRVAVT